MNTIRKYIILALGIITLSCNSLPELILPSVTELDLTIRESSLEVYRPGFHFTPKHFWMNDPNGLVYQNGYYHLFFQHYPNATVWGPMHWGHARSKDLINWERLPIALYPDDKGWIFSGSAVIDKNNTAGFGANAMVAIYTYHNSEIEKSGSELFQSQGIAYSLDDGETWIKYSENPVLENPGIRDFRDPKVFWNKDKSEWQMVLAAKDKIFFYSSTNLKEWSKLSEYRDVGSNQLGVWECPDLFELKVEGTEETKWVLIISHGSEAANGGSGTRYVIGDYDGIEFTSSQNQYQWLDVGRDNYAGVTFNNMPNDRRVLMGWMSNWDYATSTPTDNWRSALTVPRELKLVKADDSYLLTNQPVEEMSLVTDSRVFIENLETSSIIFNDGVQQYRLQFTVKTDSKNFEFIISNDAQEQILFNYDAINKQGEFNRSLSGKVDFNNKFISSKNQLIDFTNTGDELKFDIILDASSIEMFVNEGVIASSNQIFPTKPFNHLQFNLSDNQEVKNILVETLNSIW